MGSINSTQIAGKGAWGRLDYSFTRSGNTVNMDLELYICTDRYATRSCFFFVYVNGETIGEGTVNIGTSGYEKAWHKYGYSVTDSDGDIPLSFYCGYTSSGSGQQECEGAGAITFTPVYTVCYYNGDNLLESCDVNKDSEHTIKSFTLTDSSDGVSDTTFTITGNANGASGVNNTSITATKTVTTKHTHTGWSGSDGNSYGTSGSITVNSNITLTAEWRDDSSTTYSNNTIGNLSNLSWPSDGTYYTVTLDKNAENVTLGTTSLEAGKVTTHTFKGWSATTSGDVLSSTTTYTSDTTVYAIWETNTTDNSTVTLPTPTKSNDTTTYTVTLYGNGGTPDSDTINTSKVVSWTFKGWSTNSGASSGITDSYTPSSNVTLYAIWSSSDSYPSVTLPISGWSKSDSTTSYTTTLNLNGGYYPGGVTSITTTYTTKYEFSHWSTDSGSTGTTVTSISGNTYTKLYAKYKTSSTTHTTNNLKTPTKSISRTITLDANGGSVTSPQYIYGSYTFLGWYTANSTSTGSKITNTSSYYSSSNNNIYALWSSSPTMTAVSLNKPTKSVSYKVTFDPSGGTVSPTYKNVTGSYEFIGWSEDGTASNLVSNSFTTASDITLYAVWGDLSLTEIDLPTTATRESVDGEFTITLDGNGGDILSTITNPITTYSNTSFTFAGWSTVSGNSANIVSNSSYTCNEPTTLYAIWTPDTDTDGIALPTSGITKSNSLVNTYTVSLDPIDGSVDPTYKYASKIRRYTFKGWSPTGSVNNLVSSTNYIPTSDITLKAAYNTADSVNPVDLPTATKADHTFLGWSTVEDGTTYVPTRYTTSGNITLYANYLANYRASLHIWYNGKWNKVIVNLFTGDRFNSAE